MIARLLILSIVAVGCAHTITNEERLDQATESVSTASDQRELKSLECPVVNDDAKKAHDDSVEASKRKQFYESAVSGLQDKVKRYDESFAANPDLLYAANGPELQRSRERCANQLAALSREKDFFAGLVPAPVPTAKVAETPTTATKKADDAFTGDDSPTVSKSKSKKSSSLKKKRIAKGSKKRLPRQQYAVVPDAD